MRTRQTSTSDNGQTIVECVCVVDKEKLEPFEVEWYNADTKLNGRDPLRMFGAGEGCQCRGTGWVCYTCHGTGWVVSKRQAVPCPQCAAVENCKLTARIYHEAARREPLTDYTR